jgi:hypothetical protein
MEEGVVIGGSIRHRPWNGTGIVCQRQAFAVAVRLGRDHIAAGPVCSLTIGNLDRATGAGTPDGSGAVAGIVRKSPATRDRPPASATFAFHVHKVGARFGGGAVTLVGDRGMIKGPQIDLLEATEGEFHDR